MWIPKWRKKRLFGALRREVTMVRHIPEFTVISMLGGLGRLYRNRRGLLASLFWAHRESVGP